MVDVARRVSKFDSVVVGKRGAGEIIFIYTTFQNDELFVNGGGHHRDVGSGDGFR